MPVHQGISAPNSTSPEATKLLPQSPTGSDLLSDSDQLRKYSVIDPRSSGLIESTLATAKNSKPKQNEGEIGLEHTAKLGDSDLKLTLELQAPLKKEDATLQKSNFGQITKVNHLMTFQFLKVLIY